MMSAVYDGWVRMLEGAEVELVTGEVFDRNFFCEYVEVTTDYEKARRVVRSIRQKISEQAFQDIFYAACHFDPMRANAIFQYLQVGFRIGGRVVQRLSDPRVMRIMELSRKVKNEAHNYLGFVRFSEIQFSGNAVLIGFIKPKCNILYLIGDHFEQRYACENWLIYDEQRNMCAVHEKGGIWYIRTGVEITEEQKKGWNQQGEYEKLWKTFVQSIAISGRKNLKCQQQHLPKWYRSNMTEWKK